MSSIYMGLTLGVILQGAHCANETTSLACREVLIILDRVMLSPNNIGLKGFVVG